MPAQPDLLNHHSPRELEEQNRTLQEELTRRDAEITRLSNALSGLRMASNSGVSPGQYTSKFSKEFSVEKILGIGGCGCVFEARNLLDEAKYAVKRIAIDPKEDKMAKTLREVRAMAQLDHPHIVRYNSTWIEEPPEEWQWDEDEATLKRIKSKKKQLLNYDAKSIFIYIQMQLCNYSLSSWLSENMTAESRPLSRMKIWFKQMVQAVEYIHEKHLIHRDLKPANILFMEKDRLKICDLGIVIERNIENGVEITMTQTGSGTPEYMSPEQKSFISQVNAKSDVFTLGLILAEICVVMDYDKKVKIFDNYRRGRPNDIFNNEGLIKLMSELTDTDKKKRPTCRKILDDMFLN